MDAWRLPDRLWAVMEPLLPPAAPPPRGGRPPVGPRGLGDGRTGQGGARGGTRSGGKQGSAARHRVSSPGAIPLGAM